MTQRLRQFRTRSLVILFTLVPPFFISQPAVAATLYVSPNGSDSNTGITNTAPLRTISKACAVAVEFDEIKLSAGDYLESTPCNPPNNVTISGTLRRDAQGVPVRSGSTAIMNRSLISKKCIFPSTPEETLFSFVDKKNLTLKNLYLDGNNRQTGQAISISNNADYKTVNSGIVMDNLAIVNFAQNAVRFSRTSSDSLSNSYILNSSTEYGPGECNANGYSHGNIAISGGSTNVAIDNNQIVTTGFYGYGIDASGTNGTRITRNKFTMNKDQLWKANPASELTSGNFNIEFYGGRDYNVLIEDNKFDATISLVTENKNEVYKPYRFLVKGNLFDNQRDYAIEMASSGIHVEGNRFTSTSGKAYAAMRNFGTGEGLLLKDVVVKNNTMDGPQFSFFHSAWPVEGLIIVDNTAVFRDFGSWRTRVSSFISGQRSPSGQVSGNQVTNEKKTELVGLN